MTGGSVATRGGGSDPAAAEGAGMSETPGQPLETPEDFVAARASFAPYVQAKLGFRNYWYPAVFSEELGDAPQGVRLLGENVLLRRIEGTVHAVADRCLHQGVRFSRKPECYTPDTITCWYHGFTYSFRDGKLVEILTEPGSKLCGKLALKTYPVAEAKGMVFVFVGDGDPPPLAHDVPPGFLDEDLAVNGIRDEVRTNWRVGAENGFDTTHIYIHRDSVLIPGNKLVLPIGLVPTTKQAIECREQGEPKGVYDKMAESYMPVFEATIGGTKVLASRGLSGQKRVAADLSIWMPGVLKVDPFPDPEIVQFEWYVPVETDKHMYWRVLGKTAGSAEEAESFRLEFHSLWKTLALRGFNDLDIWAREGLEEFYKDDASWTKEHLFKPDACKVEWRKLASRVHRGIQPVP
jgi:carbazole 1,9a-dioxygenase terminal dioxygenase component